MIYRCHKSGLRVNLDLVFNHVYNKSKFALEAMVPNYYFLMNTEGEFSNGSFCGNDIDIHEIIDRADEKLYKEKAEKKAKYGSYR